MGLEAVTDISDLNIVWPLSTDSRKEGDDHIRNLKIAVKSLTTAGGGGLAQLFFPGSWTGDSGKFVTVKTGEDGYEHTTLTGAVVKTLYEAEANTNAFTDAHQTKLNGIETGADVTDAAAVNAAGGIVHSDISESEGFLRKTGSEAYIAIKTNFSAVSDPGSSDDSSAGYDIGSIWVNTTTGEVFQCIDATAAAAIWWSRVKVFPSPVRLPIYTYAGLPSASPDGQIAYLSGASGGGSLIFSDSGEWKKAGVPQEIINPTPPAGQITLTGAVPTVTIAP